MHVTPTLETYLGCIIPEKLPSELDKTTWLTIETLKGNPPFSADEKNKLLQEARTIKKISHDGLIPILQVAEFEKRPCVVYQPKDGVRLDRFLKDLDKKKLVCSPEVAIHIS